jgi:pyruvate oxidase
LAATDLVILVGSDFPYAPQCFAKGAKCIHIDLDSAKLGRQCKADAAILGDAAEAMRQLIKIGRRKRRTQFLEACRQNMKNWRLWQKSFEEARPDGPLRVESIFREINRIAESEAIFAADPGNTLTQAVRLLQMNGQGQRFLCPGTLSSLGYAVPAGAAAKLACPDRQVFTLSGDGAFAMSMRDIATQVKYGLSVINIVFSNNTLGYIKAGRELAAAPGFGTDLPEIDFAKATEAMGALTFSAERLDELPEIFDKAKNAETPVVINLKIGEEAPFPAHAMIMDAEKCGEEAVNIFREKYGLESMPTLNDILKGMPKE